MRFPRLISEWIHHRPRPSSAPQPPRRQRILQLAELEDRVLYSAAPLDAAALQPHQNPDAGAVNADHEAAGATTPTLDVVLATHDAAGDVGAATHEPVFTDAARTADLETSLLAEVDVHSTVPHPTHELVFVDANVEHSEQLLQSLAALDDPSRQIEVVVLSPDRDGIAQISEALATHDHLDAVHIVSHGSDAALKLGATWLHSGNVDAYAGTIAQWHGAFSSEADLLLYGCDVATNADGQALIQSLAALTGAEVAASVDATGHRLLGGDWELEATTGSIEATSAFTRELQDNWHGLLTGPLTPTGDFRVNATTNDVQETSNEDRGSSQAVALAANGDYFVVWSSQNQDSASWGVYLRKLDGSGNALTGDVLVANTTADEQKWASVALDGIGNGVVTWVATNQDGSGKGVYARRFDVSGGMVGSEFLVNTHTTNDQDSVTIAMHLGGDFVIAWEGEGPSDSDGIFFRRFNADGTAKDATDRLANLTNGGLENDPAIAMTGSGNFVIFWEQGTHIYFQRFDASGGPQNGRVQVDNFFSTSSGPAVASDAAGNFSVVYREEATLTGVWGKGFHADGTFNYSWFHADTGDSGSPSIAMADDGSFVVAYQKGGDADGLDVFGRKYNADGTSAGAAFQINSTTSNTQHLGSVAMHDADNFVVVWSGEGPGDTSGVFARQFGTSPTNSPPVITSNGGAPTATVNVSENTTDVTTVIASDPDLPGQTVAYWISGGADATLFSIDGITGALTFNTASDFESPADADANNVYKVQVTANDGNGGIDAQLISVAVTDVVEQLVVDTAGDVLDGDTSSIGALLTDRGADGFVSLREAIEAANNTAGPDTIQFNIAGAGVHTIQVLSALPVVAEAATLDAATQPGYAGTPLIELDGSLAGAGAGVIGLAIDGGNTTVRGFAIYGFSDDGLFLTSDDNVVEHNYFGTDATGLLDLGNAVNGICLADAHNNIVRDNLSAGNERSGIDVYNGSSGNIVAGNRIGLDAAGAAMGNTLNGIHIFSGATGNMIGGTAPADRNFISGNLEHGILIEDADTTGNVVVGNLIGTDATGTLPIGNGLSGVFVQNFAEGNSIGGVAPGEANVIAFNGGAGVTQTGIGDGNAIRGNSIHSNAGLGIDLADDGVTANDFSDFDTGPNDRQNFPVLTTAVTDGVTLTVDGAIHTTALTNLVVDFYSSTLSDPSLHGQGQVYLGSTTVTTNFFGNASFSNVALPGVPVGAAITATATVTAGPFLGNSSEFSLNLAAITTNSPPVITSTNMASVVENTTVVQTVTAIDADVPAQAITFSINGGADAAQFTVNASTGALSFVWAPDVESPTDAGANNVYDVTVEASDANGGTDTQAISVTVTDVDEFNVGPISDTNAAADALNENAGNGTVVGLTVFATDSDDTNNTITYLLDDNAGGRFAIDATIGLVTVTGAIDYETATSHSITVRASSSDGSFATQNFSIAVNDVDGISVGPISGLVTTEAGGTATFNVLLESQPAADVTIDLSSSDTTEGTLVPTVLANSASEFSGVQGTNNWYYGYYDKPSSSVFVPDTYDAGNSRWVGPEVNTVLRPLKAHPGATDWSVRRWVAESSGTIQVTGNLAKANVGGGDGVTGHILVNGIEQWSQAVAFNDGVGFNLSVYLSVTAGDNVDFAVDSGADNYFDSTRFNAVITTSPATLIFTPANWNVAQTVTVTGVDDFVDDSDIAYTIVTAAASSNDTNYSGLNPADVSVTNTDNDSPPVITSNGGGVAATVNVAENTTAVTTVTATDPDVPTPTLSYTISGGADAAKFAIDGSTGTLRFVSARDFESPADAGANNVYDVIVRVSDGSLSDTQAIAVTVTDSDEFDAGTIGDTDAAANSVDENSANGTVVGVTAFASDADATNSSIAYSLDDNAGGRFAIDDTTGVVTVADGLLLDSESAASHNISIRAISSDGSFSTQAFTINLNDVDEFDVGAGTDIDAATNAVNENAANGTVVGITASASDTDATNNTISYSLDDSAGGRFAINATTGVVTVADGSLLDQGAAASHDITVRATSSDGSFSSLALTVNVTTTVNSVIIAPGPATPPTTIPLPTEPAHNPPPVIETSPINEIADVIPAPVGPDPQTTARRATQPAPQPAPRPLDDVSHVSAAPALTVSALQWPARSAEPSDGTAESPPIADDSSEHVTETALSTGSGDSPYAHLQRPGAFWNGLDEVRRAVDDEVQTQTVFVGTALATASSLSVGYVIWLARSGVLVSSLLAQLPAWRVVDPLVVLDYADDRRGKNPRDDETLEDVIATTSLREHTS